MSALLLKLGLGKVAEVVIDAVSRSGDDGEDSLPPAASAFVSAGRAFLAARGGSGAPTPEQELRGLELAVAARRAELEALSEITAEVESTQRRTLDVFMSAAGLKALGAFLIADARPSCIRSLSLSFFFIHVIVGWAIVRDGDVTMSEVSLALGALAPYWVTMGSVGGIYQVARSVDKRGGVESVATGGRFGGAVRGLVGGWKGSS